MQYTLMYYYHEFTIIIKARPRAVQLHNATWHREGIQTKVLM